MPSSRQWRGAGVMKGGRGVHSRIRDLLSKVERHPRNILERRPAGAHRRPTVAHRRPTVADPLIPSPRPLIISPARATLPNLVVGFKI